MRERRAKRPCVYILASAIDGILYIGVTSQLHARIAAHQQGLVEGFTKTYGVHRLVYYEYHATMSEAIERETRLKKWKRAWKVRLIEQMNPAWVDLYDMHTGAILEGPVDASRPRR